MAHNELKRLSRRELVDIIYQMKKNEQLLQEEIVSLQEELQQKRILLSEAGSIAEAAVSITKVFSTAQEAADLYLNEISCMKAEAQKECDRKVEEAEKTVAGIFADAKKKYDVLRGHYQADYKKWMQLRAEIQKLQKILKSK